MTATLIGLRRERALYGELQLKRALCFLCEWKLEILMASNFLYKTQNTLSAESKPQGD
jgi:hypothetical protein